MKTGDIVRTGDNRLGRLMRSNGYYFHYLWIVDKTGENFSMEKFHVNEIVPASSEDEERFRILAKEFNRKIASGLSKPR